MRIGWTQALFFGLGADGTVGANKNSIKIIGENTDLFAQGYFVYDSKKSGAKTVSHLRFGKQPIKAPYLITSADFIACHQFRFVEKEEMFSGLQNRERRFFSTARTLPARSGPNLPEQLQHEILDKNIRLFVIDATKVARETGMAGRINTIMQTCFFASVRRAAAGRGDRQIKKAIEKTYLKKGEAVVEKNFEAVDQTLENLFEVKIPAWTPAPFTEMTRLPADNMPEVRPHRYSDDDRRPRRLASRSARCRSTELIQAARRSGKNATSRPIAVWEPDLCIQCGNCSFVCPHSVIRSKFYHHDHLDDAPGGFKSAPINARGLPGDAIYSLQVYLEDCTGCNLCYEVCPVEDTSDTGRRAINLAEKPADLDAGREARSISLSNSPQNEKPSVNFSTVHGVQFLEPIFEFSGACAGCGETPYIKVLTQLFGDRLLVANATGCSSIYGGNLPTTPWTTNSKGQGPAWSNSLFEDNAEFGLGMRLTADKQLAIAHQLLRELQPEIGDELVDDLINAPQNLESEIDAQRMRVSHLK